MNYPMGPLELEAIPKHLYRPQEKGQKGRKAEDSQLPRELKFAARTYWDRF